MKAIDQSIPIRRTDEGSCKYREALNDYTAEMRKRIEDAPGAPKALEILETKAREKAAKEGRLPPRDFAARHPRNTAVSVSNAGRVEDWRGGLTTPFPVPATSNGACGFPALRSPAHFGQGL